LAHGSKTRRRLVRFIDAATARTSGQASRMNASPSYAASAWVECPWSVETAARLPDTFRGKALYMKTRFTEWRLLRAYICLALIRESDDGSKIVSLARFGRYEVRLVEFSHENAAYDPPLWIELYSHDSQSGIDANCSHEIEDAVIAAEEFISRARQLNEQAAQRASERAPRPFPPAQFAR